MTGVQTCALPIGVVDETLSPEIVELLGKAIAPEALAQGQVTLCIGYDGRLSSSDYAEALINGVISTGMNAILIGQVPTPVLYFATHHFETGSGVVITGSHKPANYNGFKMMIGRTTLSGEGIHKLYNRNVMQDFVGGQGERSEEKIYREYLDNILTNFITNSVRYKDPKRKPIITLSAVKKNNYSILTIADNGLGIDLEKHGKKLFGMYKTFHEHKDAKGIGLYITKNQIDAMNGKVEVTSKVGKGTEFKIFFNDKI